VRMSRGADKTTRVFFYGLFMDESHLASKGIRPHASRSGYVEGFCLRIGERATLIPEPNSRAYGLLMEMAEADVTVLYSDQTLRDYIAEPVLVHLANDTPLAAVCYNLPAAKLTGRNPQYATALLALATKLGMPDHYLAHIRLAAEAA
jgi:hypothetical protein